MWFRKVSLFPATSIKAKKNMVCLFSLIVIAVVCYMAAEDEKFKPTFDPLQESWTKYKDYLESKKLVLEFLEQKNKVNSDIVLHSVYFDIRPQNDHSNATVIFMSVLKELRETILGCVVDRVLQNQTKLVGIPISGWIQSTFSITHLDCFLYCYDTNIQKDSVVNVIYNKSGTIMKATVQSQVVIPSNDTEEEAVMVCATGFGEVQHLDEWLTYQRTIGVKYIHLNVNPSFLINLNKSSLLQNLTDTGYIKIVVWKNCLNESQVFYYSQSLKYQDCVLRYQGKYKYMMVIDFDEYFIPLGKNKDVLSYAKSLITGRYGSVELYRPHYYCMASNANTTAVPKDGNLTELYNTSILVVRDGGKSIHLMKALEVTSVHHYGRLFPAYIYLNRKYSSDSIHCYVAHLKPVRPKDAQACT